MKKYIIIVLAVLVLASCAPKSKTAGKGSFPGAMGGGKNTPKVVTKTIAKEDVIEFADISGKLEGIVDIDLVAEVSGKIVSISKKLGDTIEAGEEIAKIDNEDIELQLTQAKANALAAKAKYDSEQIKLNISNKLLAKESISEVEYMMAKSAFETAKAAYDGAMANQKMIERQLKNSMFTAPAAGMIAVLPIKVGQYVSMGTKVASIVNNSKLIIRTGVGPSLIQKIKNNEDVCITTQLGAKTCNGKIVGIGAKPGSDNFNYPIQIEIMNTQNLLSGQLVNGKIQTGIYKNVITVNPSAVKKFYDNDIVYVVGNDNKVHKRSIKIQAEVSEKYIIESGLAPGEQIVVQGFEFVKDGIEVIAKNLSDLNKEPKNKTGE